MEGVKASVVVRIKARLGIYQTVNKTDSGLT